MPQLNCTRRDSRILVRFFDDRTDQLTFSCLKMTSAYPGHELEGAEWPEIYNFLCYLIFSAHALTSYTQALMAILAGDEEAKSRGRDNNASHGHLA